MSQTIIKLNKNDFKTIPEELFKITNISTLEDTLDLIYLNDPEIIKQLDIMNFIAEVYHKKVITDRQQFKGLDRNFGLVLQAKNIAKKGLKMYDKFLEILDDIILEYESLNKNNKELNLNYKII